MYPIRVRTPYPIRRIPTPQSLPEAVTGILEISKLRDELKRTVEVLNNKIEEANNRLEEANRKIEQAHHALLRTKEIQKGEKGDAVKGDKGDPGIDADEERVIRAVLAQIRQPKDGENADEEKIIKLVLAKFPKEEVLIRKVISRIEIPEPKRGKDGKDADEEKIIKTILDHFEKGKIKLKGEHIDGYQNAETVMRNFAARGYLHGAGDTIKAGSNITLTRNSDGTTTVASTGGGGLSVLAATGAINGSNRVFSFASAPTLVVVNGVAYRNGKGVTISGTTATLDNAPDVGGDVYGLG